MAYQTLPNTFASGSTIYSTAVSANFVSALQGYTTGSYDGWFRDVDAKEIRANTTYYMKSAGTSNFGNTTVTTFNASARATFASGIGVVATAVVGGDVSVTGNLTAPVGQFTSDVYTVAWANISASTAAISGFSTAATTLINCYRYRKVGKQVFCQFNMNGTSTGTTMSFNLPVTAGAYSPSIYLPVYAYDNTVALDPPAWVSVDTATSYNRVYCYKSSTDQSWTASGTKALTGQFWYETD